MASVDVGFIQYDFHRPRLATRCDDVRLTILFDLGFLRMGPYRTITKVYQYSLLSALCVRDRPVLCHQRSKAESRNSRESGATSVWQFLMTSYSTATKSA
jgi:hypothetical protein